MINAALKIPPGATFWTCTARALLDAAPQLLPAAALNRADLSGLRVVVPTFAHGTQLRAALGTALGCPFIAPRICTIAGWLALQPPDHVHPAPLVSGNERLMGLYAELRQHVWLKKLFGASRNTDLLPLSQTLLALSDELTAALLPVLQSAPGSAELRWEAALAQLPPAAQSMLSEEAQLVWTVWKTQLDGDDPQVSAMSRMLEMARNAQTPLVWITPVAVDACTDAFLQAWAQHQPVLPVLLDWRSAALSPVLLHAWPEVVVDESARLTTRSDATPTADVSAVAALALSPAASLEEEAQRGAQTVVDWLSQGKSAIAIVAQDRVVARRIRALLQRAAVQVADETGWKLSTTRAAAALAAWFDVVTSRAESTALLDFLKSPFLLAAADHKADQVMAIETALRRGNVSGGWRAVAAAVAEGAARTHLQYLGELASRFTGRHTISDWLGLTRSVLDALGMTVAFANDAAGTQVCLMLDEIDRDCAALAQAFSFAEWRAYVGLQLEFTAFLPPFVERRVIMLPLNGMHLRSFDAVLVVGADAAHLPSSASETLFFANAVRHELGLATRDSRQLQQLRDLAELLVTNPLVVLSWQAHRNGEPNPVSNWIARLELHLMRTRQDTLRQHATAFATRNLRSDLPVMPAPAAPDLLPARLSASGYASLSACPYQFFATRMLGLSGLDELSEQPEKRDYGDWLHQILNVYHSGVRDQTIAVDQRGAFLQTVTDQVFQLPLAKSAAALGYFDRWQKAMPAYLAWSNARAEQGWHFVAAEVWREQPLRWQIGDTAGEILLNGRIDRIDCNDRGDIEVLDYKTSHVTALKKRIDAQEDHQLAFYGLLAQAPPASAAYIGLEPVKGRIEGVHAPDYAHWQHRLQRQIGEVMTAIATGAPLRASGIETVCQYCDVRGVCRKGAW